MKVQDFACGDRFIMLLGTDKKVYESEELREPREIKIDMKDDSIKKIECGQKVKVVITGKRLCG